MITGRGPGAPGVTPGLKLTRRRATAGGTGGQAVDLGEIRRSEEALNVLAARGAGGPQHSRDPALALLGALVADVDLPGAPAGPGDAGPADLWSGRAGDAGRAGPGDAGQADLWSGRAGSAGDAGRARDAGEPGGVGGTGQAQPAWPGRVAVQRAAAWQALAGAQSRGMAAWLRAAVAGGVVAGLVSVTSLIATSMLARLARGPVRGGRWQQRPVRPRRVR